MCSIGPALFWSVQQWHHRVLVYTRTVRNPPELLLQMKFQRFRQMLFSTFESVHISTLSVFLCDKTEKAVSVCGPAHVLALKSETCPSVERTSTPSITPSPSTPIDSGQCAKQLWKRPHAFSLIECPFRDVFPTLTIFIRSIELPTHFCHVRLVFLQV